MPAARLDQRRRFYHTPGPGACGELLHIISKGPTRLRKSWHPAFCKKALIRQVIRASVNSGPSLSLRVQRIPFASIYAHKTPALPKCTVPAASSVESVHFFGAYPQYLMVQTDETLSITRLCLSPFGKFLGRCTCVISAGVNAEEAETVPTQLFGDRKMNVRNLTKQSTSRNMGRTTKARRLGAALAVVLPLAWGV